MHQPAWFATPIAAFLAYIVIEHRALRLRAGSRHWPSEGMIRFTLNTNIGFACWNLLLGGLVHLLAAALAPTSFDPGPLNLRLTCRAAPCVARCGRIFGGLT